MVPVWECACEKILLPLQIKPGIINLSDSHCGGPDSKYITALNPGEKEKKPGHAMTMKPRRETMTQSSANLLRGRSMMEGGAEKTA